MARPTNRGPKPKTPLAVEALRHDEATRKNIPTAEYQSVMAKEQQSPLRVAYERRPLAGLSGELQRNRDLDPQLVWRGKDQQDWSDLVVHAPPLYIQEKIHPKVLIDDLVNSGQWLVNSKNGSSLSTNHSPLSTQPDLFADFNGLPDSADKTDFYQHEGRWQNRMILGDSLQVMASLAEREGLRGQVQCIYFDPPYGIKFNSNFQWSTTSRDVKDGNAGHITREPEQVKAFRDTWRDGIHSYLTYLRDRLTVARDLLTDSGSVFVQIGGENLHRVRAVMDEVFGEQNFCAEIIFRKTARTSSNLLPTENDFLLWYARKKYSVKFRPVFRRKEISELKSYKYLVSADTVSARFASDEEKSDSGVIPGGWKLAQLSFCVSGDPGRPEDRIYRFRDKDYDCGAHRHWKTTNPKGLDNLLKSQRLIGLGSQLNFIRYFEDFSVESHSTQWTDTGSAGFSNSDPKIYVVQTDSLVIQRCVLLTTDPGDLVLDPTCGSGTTAYVAEQWGRRWITLDTSRVALALARARIMGARYPYYLLADSAEGQLKEAEITRTAPSTKPTRGSVRQGFVYERVPHITLKSIANNAEIDVIWDKFQQKLEPLREQLNKAVCKQWQEWEIPRSLDEAKRNPGQRSPDSADAASGLLKQWWDLRIARQKEIDASIVAKADSEYLYDKPYEDKKRVRVAGPFTVESLFVRHAYFLGANDPYKSLKTTLKAEINEDAWATLNSDTSRPFDKPKSGRIAVKVINHLGDEVMKVFRV